VLEELSVRNFALIDSLSLRFEGGFNVLSGETGAGKSIIVGSLSFLLGAKADADVIRTGAGETSVSAVVSVRHDNRDLLAWLESRDIALDPEEHTLVVRRTLKSSGRSSIFIQDTPVSRADLAECMAMLFDLHGQHSHESLLRKETHRLYLDRFASLENDAAQYNRLFVALTEKKKALSSAQSSAQDREARLELLRYGIEELTKAAPRRGESRELEAEAQRLGDFEKLSEQVSAAAAALYEDGASLLSQARKARAALEAAAGIDPSLESLCRRLEAVFYEAEDLAGNFRSYREDLTFDPRRLEEVEERLALLYRLKKKYGGDEEGMLLWREKAEAEMEALDRGEESRDKLQGEIAALEREIRQKAQALSAKRAAGAQPLGERISGILKSLGMPAAVFQAAVRQRKGESGGPLFGPWGTDEVEFLISANAGEPLKELSRIASGGELARVMLAIKTVLARADTIETLVFDEVDTGIGGQVALSVGEYLARIADLKQIFCITHLASIAVRADNHLKVEKRLDGGRTVTAVSALAGEARRREIARMLAGDEGAAALAHADELLRRCRAAGKSD